MLVDLSVEAARYLSRLAEQDLKSQDVTQIRGPGADLTDRLNRESAYTALQPACRWERGNDMGQAAESPEETVLAALRLARERVTGDDLVIKRSRRQAISEAIAGIEGAASAPGRPDAAELRILLEGQPDDRLRTVLDTWDA